MSIDRFQLVFTTTLAVATGVLATMALGPSSAEGYPAAASVSYGHNPVMASGGSLPMGESITVFSAPADQDIIITDVVLTPDAADYYCMAGIQFRLALGSGASVGTYSMQIKSDYDRGYTSFSQNVIAQYASGIRIPAGDSLQASADFRYEYSCDSGSISVSYAMSGY
ncbi:MAG: hypothetical protein GY888_30015, partial [Planctomycetaceae bacterium]|nr:hypothetical protein [Planctomycetaceae bacterium]